MQLEQGFAEQPGPKFAGFTGSGEQAVAILVAGYSIVNNNRAPCARFPKPHCVFTGRVVVGEPFFGVVRTNGLPQKTALEV